jgi:hypothetical protein
LNIRRPQRMIAWCALSYLVVIRWSLAVNGTLHADNGRDLAIAWRIVHAHDFPLRGPFQSGGVHLGPLYPYLSAIPLALFGTASSLILFVSLLSLVSLYFGYKLGGLLFGREVGLLPFLGIALLLPMKERKTRGVVVGLAVGFVLYLPYVIYQVSHGWGDMRTLLNFLQTDTSGALRMVPLTTLPSLFLRYNEFSASWAGGLSQFVTPAWSRVPVIACLRLIAIVSLLGLAVNAFGIISGWRRTPNALVLSWLLLGWLIIPFLRPSLPWYVLFPVYPAHLLLASLAIARLGQATKRLGAWPLVPYSLVGAVFVLSPLLMAHTLSRFAQQGRLQISAWLMKDLHHRPAETPGKFVIPYLGARAEEKMVQRLTTLPGADTSLYHKIQGVPLWSNIFSTASLFSLHPPSAPSGEPSPYHLVGVLKGDLPGRPIGEVVAVGPMILIRSLPSIVYEGVRYSVAGGAGWHTPGYDDSAWKPITLPGYAVPIPWEYPPRPSMSWERRPVYVRVKLVHRVASPTFLGVSFPTFGSPDEDGQVERLFLNGIEVGQPSLHTGDLLLYDITPYLRLGDNLLALAVGGGPHFILDLFTITLER